MWCLKREGSLEPENGQIIIDRIRHFRQFETPSSMKCIDEITFYNTGEELLSVKYDLDEFKPLLHIFDSRGEQLEFYGNSDAENKPNSRVIEIEFPKERPLPTGEYRTIRLEYVQEVQEMELRTALITIPLHDTASVYTFIKQCENYEFTVHYGELENVNLTVERGDSFFHAYSKPVKTNSIMYVILEHKLPKSLSRWYNMGGAFGIISAISIPFLYHYDPVDIKDFAAFGAITISILIIIKGWLFFKNMDRRMRLYDLFYQFLVLLIFAEVSIMTLHFSFVLSRT